MLVVTLCSSGGAQAQSAAATPNNLPHNFTTVLNWSKLPDGRRFGSTAGVDVAPDGSVWTYDRCGANSCVGSDLDPILHLDPSGRLIESFGAGLLNFPHGFHLDMEGNVWVTDHGVEPANDKGHQVLKFSPDGRLLMTLGRAGSLAADSTRSISRRMYSSHRMATSSSPTVMGRRQMREL